MVEINKKAFLWLVNQENLFYFGSKVEGEKVELVLEGITKTLEILHLLLDIYGKIIAESKDEVSRFLKLSLGFRSELNNEDMKVEEK